METKFCHSCGTKIPISSTFCTDCGAKQHLSSSAMVENQDTLKPIENTSEKHTDFKKPFYKKWWFITLTIILLLNLIISFNSVKCINCNGNGSTISGTCVYCKGSGKISKSENKRLFGIEEMP